LLANKAKNADIAVAMASIFNEVSKQKGKLECSVYLFLVPYSSDRFRLFAENQKLNNMNRRFFIKMSALVSLLVAAFPASMFRRGIFGHQGESLIFGLPKMNTHVRHGLLTEVTEGISKFAPSWLSDYRKEVFLKDGFAESDADLTYISMKIDQQLLNIGLKQDSFFVATNQDTSSIPIVGNEIIPFYKSENFTGELLKFNQDILIDDLDSHEILLIPIKGSIQVNDMTVDDSSGLLLKDVNSIKMVTDSEAVVSIIRCLSPRIP
jgi:hypothetical protein